MGGKQLGYRFAQGFAYGDYEQTTAKKRTRREKFLDEMDQVVPWQALIKVPTMRRSYVVDTGQGPVDRLLGLLLSVVLAFLLGRGLPNAAGPLWILRRYLLRNVITSVPVLLTLNAADAVLILGALGFLGLGLPESIPEWGSDLQQALTALPTGVW